MESNVIGKRWRYYLWVMKYYKYDYYHQVVCNISCCKCKTGDYPTLLWVLTGKEGR